MRVYRRRMGMVLWAASLILIVALPGWAAEPRVMLCVDDLCLPPIEDPRELSRSLVTLGLATGGILDGQPMLEPRS